MAQVHHYSHPETPAGPGFDTIIEQVAILPDHAFTAAAAVGDASILGVSVDDPDLAYDFVGLNRWYVVEDQIPGTGPEKLIWNGYIDAQRIGRSGTAVVFPFGRAWKLALVETSAILSFRIISGEDGNRPAETAGERLLWLVQSDYFIAIGDNGLVVYPDDVDMDANDYRGQTPRDVLSDLAAQTQYNYWAFYDPDADDDQRISLAFFDPDSELYTSPIRISNDPADLTDPDTFPAHPDDAELERKPDRVAAGGYLQYAAGFVYDTDLDTADEFAFRDRVAPFPSVKTQAKAEELLADFLATFDEQDEKVTDRIQLPAARLNEVKHGHRMQVKYVHMPNYQDWRWVRVVRKTLAPPENRTQTLFDVDLELVPVAGLAGEPSAAADRQTTGTAFTGIPVLPRATTPGNLLVAVVIGGGNTSVFPTDVRFEDNPPTSGGSPNVPPFPGHAGWTVLGSATTDYSGMNITGPSATAGHIVAIAYRFVQPGEITTTPVQVSTDGSPANTGAWLWEFPTTDVPTLVGTLASTHVATNPAHFVVPAGSGHLLAAFTFPQADYGNPPYAATPDAGSTAIRKAWATNNPAMSPGAVDDGSLHGWLGPWAYIAEYLDATSDAIGVTLQAITAYTSLNGCGVVIALPADAAPDGVPDIVFPGNQSL